MRETTGAKGKALFHPIRLALTGEQEGLELDLAVPLIEQRRSSSRTASGIRADLLRIAIAPRHFCTSLRQRTPTA